MSLSAVCSRSTSCRTKSAATSGSACDSVVDLIVHLVVFDGDELQLVKTGGEKYGEEQVLSL